MYKFALNKKTEIMENILKVMQCLMISGIFYLLGVLTLHPSFIIFKYLEKKGFDYDDILDQGHKIILLGWVITFIIITWVVFYFA
jgi:hypothetical protein